MTQPKSATFNCTLWLGLAGVMLFFRPLWDSGNALFFRDLHVYFVPMKAFLAKCLQNGELALWCPHAFCGTPFFSDIQSGVLYPPSLLLAVLPFPYALNIFILFHLATGFVGCFHYIRANGHSDHAAAIAGLSFVLGGYGVGSINTLNNLCTIVWLPAVLWAFHLSRSHRWASPLTAIFLCLAVLGGEPQLWLIIVAVLAFAAVMPSADTPKQRGRRLVAVAGVVFAALALAAIQLGPTAVDWLQSVRRQGFAFDQAAAFSLAPARLIHLVWPRVFPPDVAFSVDALNVIAPDGHGLPWLLTIYPGFVIVPLAICAIALGDRRALGWGLAAALGLLLALGHHTPIFGLFYRLAPIFRYPEKFMALTHFALVVAAARGLDRLNARLAPLAVGPSRLGVVLAIFLFADLLMAHYFLNPVCDAGFFRRLGAPLKSLVGKGESGRLYSAPVVPGPGLRSIEDAHKAWQSALTPNLGVLHGLSHVDGQAGMELNYQWLITEMVSRPWPQRLAFLRLAGVGHIVSDQALDQVPAIASRLVKLGPNVFGVPDRLPRAYLSGMVLAADTFALERMVAPDFDPRSATFGPAHLAERLQRPFFQPVEFLRAESNAKVTIQTHAPQPCLLVFTEAFYPGWRVWVDGKPAPLVAANLLFQGVALAPGEHQVTFAFRPLYFETFALISVLALVATAWWLWWGLVRAPHPAKAQRRKPSL